MSLINNSIYRLKFLVDNGYRRYKCKSCGAYFWSLIPRDYCNDSPCVDYTFFNIKSYTGYSLKDVRDKFLYFFNKNKHEIIKAAPTVARWREDLYLTIASIVVFQPHVTSGLIPPPANPLVIAQPCVRLEDIDAVGYTFGRHLTNFIMGGHHAFNYPNKRVYWTEETVAYAREFFTKEFGIPEEELIFKESWWEGGGNAGPSFEVSVGGLELATLVFMMYAIEGREYKEIPLKIVDTGYGIERITWFVNKSPTAFHAIYGGLVDKYHEVLGLDKPDPQILKVGAIYVGKINVKDVNTIINHRRRIAESLSIPISAISKQLDDAIKIYTMLDHIKTTLLLLGDGVVPSNSGEGYLARLVIRRVLRLLKKLNLYSYDILSELVKQQIKYFSNLYPQIYKRKEYIYEVLQSEFHKYEETLNKGISIAYKYIKRRSLDLNTLIELYDSHGVPPEFVAELASKYGHKIEVPRDFYSLVAKKHSSAPIKKVEAVKLPQEIINWAKSFPGTKRLFHENPYLKEFKARVIGVKSKYIILDRTAFYPEGGGQKSDTGILKFKGDIIAKVINVQSVNNVIVHELSKEINISTGVDVTGIINWSERYARMRHHTATHILLGAARRVLGDHVWQAGAEKTEAKGRLDLTHFKLPTPKEIETIERLINEIINKGIDVKVHYLPKYEAEEKFGLTIYQGGVPLVPILRIVEIPGWDAEACFGTHLRNTSEVGALKIINVEKIADGVIRFEYIAGTELVKYLNKMESSINEAAKLLNADIKTLKMRVLSLMEERKRIKELISQYRSFWFNIMLNKINKESSVIREKYRLFIYEDVIKDKEGSKEFVLRAIKKSPNLILVRVTPTDTTLLIEISLGKEVAKDLNALNIFEELQKTLKVKGGGKRDHITLRMEKKLDINELKEILINIINNLIMKSK